jgi:hypothetical protein
MNNNLVSLRLDELNASELATSAIGYVSHMTNNPNFESPNPTLSLITDLADALNKAIGLAMDGGKESKLKRDAAEQQLINELIVLAHYVDDTARGDESIIVSAGMSVRKPSTKYPVPLAPVNLRIARKTIVGQATLICDRVVGARMYVIQTNATPALDAAAWVQVSINTTTRYEITNMNLTTKIAYRISALGTAGQSAWSEIIFTPTW